MKFSKGFTLVELLIVISIIAILSTVGLTIYSAVQKNVRDARRKDDLRAIKVGLELYYQKNNKYPITEAVYSTHGSSSIPSFWFYSTQGTSWISSLVPDFMPKVPIDPLKNSGQPWIDNQYGYAYFASDCASYKAGQFYALVTQLENKTDNQRNEIQNYTWCDGKGLYSTHGWSKYSYILTSQD